VGQVLEFFGSQSLVAALDGPITIIVAFIFHLTTCDSYSSSFPATSYQFSVTCLDNSHAVPTKIKKKIYI